MFINVSAVLCIRWSLVVAGHKLVQRSLKANIHRVSINDCAVQARLKDELSINDSAVHDLL